MEPKDLHSPFIFLVDKGLVFSSDCVLFRHQSCDEKNYALILNDKGIPKRVV